MIPDPKANPLGWLQATGDRPWMTTGEAARLLGVTPERLCHLRRSQRLPPTASLKVGRRAILWASGEMERLVTEATGSLRS